MVPCRILAIIATGLATLAAADALPSGGRFETPVPYDRSLQGGGSTSSHGDTWYTAWSRDGTLFCLVDDSKGFDGSLRETAPGNTRPGRNVTVATLAGAPGEDGFRGAPVRGRHHALACFGGENEGDAALPHGGIWKGSGIGSFDGVLYLTVNDQTRLADKRVRATGAAILASPDGGVTWRNHEGGDAKPRGFMFTDPRFSRIAFVQYGRDGRAPGDPDGSGAWVYAVSNDGAWDNGDHLYLGRVRRDLLPRLRAADWSFFAGLSDGTPQWGPLEGIRPVFSLPGGIGQTMLHHVAARGCYILPTWRYVRDPAITPAEEGYYGKASSGHTAWAFYAAAAPWGPWRAEHPFATRDWRGEGFYNPAICAAYSTADRLVMLCSGDYWSAELYRMHLVSLLLEPAALRR